MEKSGEEDDEEEDDEGSEDSEARTGDAGEGQTDVTVNGEEGETGDVAAGTATNMTADTDGGSAVKTSDEIDTDIRNYDYAKLKVLVQKSMEKKPPEVMPRLNLTSVPRKNRKQIRSMSKHLYRIKLDQRHALHDPRFGKARSIRLGLGSVKIFNDLLQGYSKGNNEQQLTQLKMKKFDSSANEKEDYLCESCRASDFSITACAN